jgi:hypothetical protein
VRADEVENLLRILQDSRADQVLFGRVHEKRIAVSGSVVEARGWISSNSKFGFSAHKPARNLAQGASRGRAPPLKRRRARWLAIFERGCERPVKSNLEGRLEVTPLRPGGG